MLVSIVKLRDGNPLYKTLTTISSNTPTMKMVERNINILKNFSSVFVFIINVFLLLI